MLILLRFLGFRFLFFVTPCYTNFKTASQQNTAQISHRYRLVVCGERFRSNPVQMASWEKIAQAQSNSLWTLEVYVNSAGPLLAMCAGPLLWKLQNKRITSGLELRRHMASTVKVIWTTTPQPKYIKFWASVNSLHPNARNSY